MNIQVSDQTIQNTAMGVGGGTLTVAGAFALWFRKLIGLPKRVKNLETTNLVVLENLGAQTKYLLAQNNHQRDTDKNPGMVYAEKKLREADDHMDKHLRSLIGDN